MKRQLLFRAWDKLRKQYLYPDKGNQGHFYLTLDGKFINIQNGSGGKEYEVQQFTGLKDSKGKKIYEGDIILLNKGKDYQSEYTVVYQPCHFFLLSEESDKYGPFTAGLPMSLQTSNPIIIGNIFEGIKKA
jgi:hypothetical protein